VGRLAATVGYVGADVVRSQRVLVPVVVYLAVIGVLFSGDPGPLPAPWVASAFALYPVAAWLALLVANDEPPDVRAVTVVSAGAAWRVVAATLVVALAADALLVALAIVVPALFNHYPVTRDAIVAGLLTHVTTATTGTAVGLLVARPLVRKAGWSFLVGVIVVVVTAVQPWLPPVGSAIRILTVGGSGLWADALLGLVLACAAAVVAWAAERR
jgi:hypothetical protein